MAGCTAMEDSGQSQDNSQDNELPPGVSSNGVEDWGELIDSHRSFTEGEATSVRVESKVTEQPRIKDYTLYRNVSVDGDVYMKKVETTDGSEKVTEVWDAANDSSLDVRTLDGGLESFLEAGEQHPYKDLMATSQIHILDTVRKVEYTNGSARKMNISGFDVWRIRAETPTSPTVSEGELTDKKAELNLYVNASGYIHRLGLLEGYRIDGELVRDVDTTYDFNVVSSVEKPGWVDQEIRINDTQESEGST